MLPEPSNTRRISRAAALRATSTLTISVTLLSGSITEALNPLISTTTGFDCVNQLGLALTKETSTTNLLSGGETLTYTITIANTGTVEFTGMLLEDLIPLGVNYVEDSARIYYPVAMTNTVYDRFNFRYYTDNDGTANWLNDWQEEGESDGAAAGSVGVSADFGLSPTESFALEVGGQDNGAWRAVDMAGYRSRIFVAHSTDGLTWRRAGCAVEGRGYGEEGLDAVHAEDMSLVRIAPDTYRMYYAACDTYGNWRIASAITEHEAALKL